MVRVRALVFLGASLLAACGGESGATSPPHAPQAEPTLIASPSSVVVNLYNSAARTASVNISSPNNGALQGLQWSATDLSFLSVSLQSVSPASTTLNVQLFGGGSSTITVRDSAGEYINVPVTGEACGRPDLLDYAALLVPANGASAVPVTARTYEVAIGSKYAAPGATFQPALWAHIVVDGASTIDPQATLAPATAPPSGQAPSPAPTSGDIIGYESGAMPQLSAGNSYTIYVYDDTCEMPWRAGSFST